MVSFPACFKQTKEDMSAYLKAYVPEATCAGYNALVDAMMSSKPRLSNTSLLSTDAAFYEAGPARGACEDAVNTHRAELVALYESAFSGEQQVDVVIFPLCTQVAMKLNSEEILIRWAWSLPHNHPQHGRPRQQQWLPWCDDAACHCGVRWGHLLRRVRSRCPDLQTATRNCCKLLWLCKKH